MPITRSRATRLAAILLAAATVATLAGCSSNSGATTSDGKTVLKVYGWKGGDTEPANIAEVNKAFEKANPSIKLDFQYIPANDTYTQRVQPELLAGKSADVIMTDASKVTTWGKAGYLEDLSSQSWTKNVLPAVQPFTKLDSKVYAEPMELIGISLYANKSLLEKAGVQSVPTTWPDFLTALDKVKAAGITPIALPNKNGWTGEAALNAIAATKVYQDNPKWDQQFTSGKADFTDWSSSLDQLMQLQDKGYVNYKNELGVDEWSQGLSDFTAGKSAFYFQGAWNQSAIAKAGIKDEFVPWPAGGAGTKPTANLFAGTMWSINARSSAKSAAEKYLAFWANADNAKPFLQAENAIAPFTGATSPSTDATKTFVSTVESGNYRILPSNSWFNATNEATMQKQLQALQLGQITDKQFLAQMDKLR